MRVDFNTNHLQQKNHTNFKSKLPSINAIYNINKLQAKFIPDYWPQLMLDSLSSSSVSREKALSITPFKKLLTDLYNNFDNNILSLSLIKKEARPENTSDVFVFRLYKNTDELLKDSKSLKVFNSSTNYLNNEIRIRNHHSGNYIINTNGTSIIYEKKYDGKDPLQKNDVDILTRVLTKIISPGTDEHKAIYNTYNSWGEETFLKAFREQ